MPRDVFPYRFAPPPPLPRYARHRSEGEHPFRCLLHSIDYLRKYRRKVWEASPDVVSHLAKQRALMSAVAAEAPSGPALAFVGDLMWIRNGWDGFLDPAVLDYLNSHEAVVGNLETVISPRVSVAEWLPDRLRFNSRPELLTSFRRPDGRNTFAALSLANNHALDFGSRALLDTLSLLSREGIAQSGVRRGEDEPAFALVECGDVRVGFYAATWRQRGSRGQPLLMNEIAGLERPEDGVDLDPARRALVEMAERGAEVRVVALHWGYEYEMFPTPHQMQVARELVCAGADIVVGTHPHVIQPAEVCLVNGYESGGGELPPGSLLRSPEGRRRKALILYSLGNFATAMYTLSCRVGLIASVRFHRCSDGVDWGLAPWRLVVNVPRHGVSGKRRLLFLEDWLHGSTEVRPEVSREIMRLRGHIPWPAR